MYKLGEALPNSPHAVSVSLPTWADVVGYEERDPRVIQAMANGYPRFVYNKLVQKLFAECKNKFANENEFCHAYPSKQTAKWCIEFCEDGKIEEFSDGIFAVILPKGLEDKAKEFWQHSGFGVSSRLAENRQSKAKSRKSEVIAKLAKLSGANESDIYLFQSGISAVFIAHQLVARTTPTQRGGKPIEGEKDARHLSANKTIQLGFPYVDTLKIQEKFGTCEFVGFDDYEKLAATKASAIFTEYPLNPMLQLVDFEKVRKAAPNTPIIIDDTLSAWQNFNALEHGDIAVTSLTKFFSGIGDVMAGALILNKNSVHYQNFKTQLNEIYEDLLFADDAEVLANNCQDFESRIAKVTENAAQLSQYLQQILNSKSQVLNHEGMITIVLPSEEQAVKFYDSLNISKGPSLGTEYTLACPYTLLAHYFELDWAESVGVPRHLIRISVGCEDTNELKQKFEKALIISTQ